MKVNLPSNGLSRIMLSTIHIQILSCVLLILIKIHCIVYMHSRQQTATRLNIHNFFSCQKNEMKSSDFFLCFLHTFTQIIHIFYTFLTLYIYVDIQFILFEKKNILIVFFFAIDGASSTMTMNKVLLFSELHK